MTVAVTDPLAVLLIDTTIVVDGDALLLDVRLTDAVLDELDVSVPLVEGVIDGDGVPDTFTGTTNTAWNMLLAGAVASRVYPDPAVADASCVVS